MQFRAVRISHSWQVLHPRAHSGCTKCKQAPVQHFPCGQGSPVPLWRQHSLNSLSSGSQGLSDSFPWAQSSVCHSVRFPHPFTIPCVVTGARGGGCASPALVTRAPQGGGLVLKITSNPFRAALHSYRWELLRLQVLFHVTGGEGGTGSSEISLGAAESTEMSGQEALTPTCAELRGPGHIPYPDAPVGAPQTQSQHSPSQLCLLQAQNPRVIRAGKDLQGHGVQAVPDPHPVTSPGVPWAPPGMGTPHLPGQPLPVPDHPLQEGILPSENPESSSLPQLSFRVLWQGKVGISSCRGSSGEAPPWDTQGDTGGGSEPLSR